MKRRMFIPVTQGRVSRARSGLHSVTTSSRFRSLFLFTCVFLTCLFPRFDASGQRFVEGVPLLHASKPALLDGFGYAVASEGRHLVVGAPHAAGVGGQSGKVFLFRRDNGTMVREFVPPSPLGDDLFGLSVKLTPSSVIVGAPRGQGKVRRFVGSVSVFDRETGKLRRVITSPNPFAEAFGHALAVQGSLLAVGDPEASTATKFYVGEGYVVDPSAGKIHRTFSSPHAENNRRDRFGHALAFLGSTLAISAPLAGTERGNHGRVFLFDWESGQLQGILESPAPQPHEYFGWALAGDAESLVVGALRSAGAQPGAGAAYLYSNTGQLIQQFQAPDPQPDDHFGEAVALLRNAIIVGAPGDDTAGVDAGAVFVFDRRSGTLKLKIANPSTPTGAADLFGLSLSGEGEYLAVGSPYGDVETMPDAGLVHQFTLPVGTP